MQMEFQLLTEQELDFFRCGNNMQHESENDDNNKNESRFNPLMKNFQDEDR